MTQTPDPAPPTPTRPTSGRRPAAVLVGFMGAGKSTVGRILADRLGVDFVDTDVELVRRTGRSIPEIFESDGVEGFRVIEENVVTDVLDNHGGVVSLGGGAVTTAGVREALTDQRVAYLNVSPERGYARVSGTDRPLLATEDPAARYAELLAERTGTYASVCSFEVDADADPETVADAIVAQLARELM
ncbi:shikimate kinase [Gordonia sp. zg691]|uniref:Shikimate kinase n=1 Tax=Gordonia jinghuaiqii TaxID=2758710 RepID=A0A7D7LVR0_9ACTN|nr:shikimate kinase [Gordonia jinghuaiqii]MBD0861469.1 shikimate kinase [Gordonia jinghuaiqii]MCR5976382.1 shikimate kinase [Gordonia jinghuaiqii]QMT03597.1 shikimate kinase [Gordonia jinghuaiqii]